MPTPFPPSNDIEFRDWLAWLRALPILAISPTLPHPDWRSRAQHDDHVPTDSRTGFRHFVAAGWPGASITIDTRDQRQAALLSNAASGRFVASLDLQTMTRELGPSARAPASALDAQALTFVATGTPRDLQAALRWLTDELSLDLQATNPLDVVPQLIEGALSVRGLDGQPVPSQAVQLESLTRWHLGRIESRGCPVDRNAISDAFARSNEATEQAGKLLKKHLRHVLDADLFGDVSIPIHDDDALSMLLRQANVFVADFHLDALRHHPHEAARAIARLRELHASRRTVTTLAEHIAHDRVHPHFVASAAASGRMACREPNLQGFPKGNALRNVFRARGGRLLITADFAGAELRVLAQMSRDERLIEQFAKGADVHAAIASWLFRKPVSLDENPQLRAAAKALSFGICYGMGTQGLAQRLGIDVAEAEALMTRFFKAMPDIERLLREEAEASVERGYARSIMGRAIPLGEGHDGAPLPPSQLRRLARNFPIQGSAAEVFKLAVVRVEAALSARSTGDATCGIVNMIHDELVVEAAKDDADEVAQIVETEMLAAARQLLPDVPSEVDISHGDTWC